jgi:uncharacterized protein (DUF924 family)
MYDDLQDDLYNKLADLSHGENIEDQNFSIQAFTHLMEFDKYNYTLEKFI